MSWTPPPGTIGLTHAYGYAHLIGALGQLAVAESIRYTHAFVVVDELTVVEPWPSGARMIDREYFVDDPVAYVWLPTLTDEDRERVAQAARGLDGTTYRIRDFHTVTAWRMGRRGRRLCRAISDPRRLPPGRFVAEVYRRAGMPLFGGRPDVTVGDLASLILAVDGWHQRVVYG